MKIAHAVGLGAALAVALIASVLLAAPASAQVPDPQIVKVETGVACGTVTVTLTNSDVGAYVWGFATGPVDGGPIGATGSFDVPVGKTVKTIKLPEDSFNGRGFVTLGVQSGPNAPRQPFLDLGLVTTDCDGVPPVTYPADCEISGGVDDGESGKQANPDAPCVSNSPGYEADEVGKACELTTGEPGRGTGVVTNDRTCRTPAADDEGDVTTTPPAVPEFATCAEASAAGVFDIPASDPNYRADMDSDSDGIACERPDAALDGGEQVPVVPNAVDTGRA